jgi:cytochrome c5
MIRVTSIVVLIAGLLGCGGSETAPAAAPTPPPVAETTPPPAPPVEEAPPQPDFATLNDQDKQAFLMDLGKKVYETGGSGGIACKTCHADAGQGVPGAFPPLVGQQELMGDCAKHAGYVVKGLSGKITVGGVEYNGVMPAQANLSDLEIAAVISFERNSWGNSYGFCMPESVAAVR